MPTEQFTHGYALLIAVNENLIPNYALPAVAQDAAALQSVLINPERCAYLPENVRFIRGPEASRRGIYQGIEWLKEKLARDKSDNATAILYYTGHGAYNRENKRYYLLPYDVRQPLLDSMLKAEDMADEIEKVQPRRMLVILDCCHAGGMGIKGEDLLAESNLLKSAAPPKARSVVALMQGQGRAVLSSSSATESSYIRGDRSMSIFTYHLIEALSGSGQPEDTTEVLVSDVMGYVSRAVPQSAWREYEVSQTPVYQLSGENFPVALRLGDRQNGKASPSSPAGTFSTAGPATQGGAYVMNSSVSNSDFSNGKMVWGDITGNGKTVLAGTISGSVLNIGSQLNQVTQTIRQSQAKNPADRADLIALVAAMQSELEQVPGERRKEAEMVLNRLAQTTNHLQAGDADLVTIDSHALVRAAYNLGDIRPGLPAVARQIAAAASRMAT
jgi:hypothetical protein